jgi:elongation factor 1-beta
VSAARLHISSESYQHTIHSLRPAFLSAAPDSTTYPHTARWYRHIASYSAEHSSLPQGDKPSRRLHLHLCARRQGGDDEDIDLFGEDDGKDDQEVERLKAARVTEYN